MKNGVDGKVLGPTVEQITAALRLCAVEEPAETYPCEQCYLYPYSKDGRMSTGRTCFEHLGCLPAHRPTQRLRPNAEQACAGAVPAGGGPTKRLPRTVIFFSLVVSRKVTGRGRRIRPDGGISAPQGAETFPKPQSVLEWQDKACYTRRSTA